MSKHLSQRELERELSLDVWDEDYQEAVDETGDAGDCTRTLFLRSGGFLRRSTMTQPASWVP